MHSSCLACHARHPSNAALPQLEVGDCIAFAPEVGRLWVICRACGEWNLVPIEERWEAVEACERLYESSVERGAAGGLGRARLEGLDLIRVGAIEELPTLRYGSRLRHRSRRHTRRNWLRGVAVLGSILGLAGVAGLLAGGAGVATVLGALPLAGIAASVRRKPPVASVPTHDGRWLDIRPHQLQNILLVPEGADGWFLHVARGVDLRGATAIEAVRLLMPLLNRSSDPRPQLRRALRYIDEKGGTVSSVFAAASRRRGKTRRARLAKLDPYIRLALEILAAREVEDRAISIDLEPLKRSWQHAEELAAIEDDLTFTLEYLDPLYDAGAEERPAEASRALSAPGGLTTRGTPTG